MESRNASFFEDVFPYRSKEKPSSSKQVLETIHENSQDEDTDGEVELGTVKGRGQKNHLVQIF